MKKHRLNWRNLLLAGLLTSAGTLAGTTITMLINNIFGWGSPSSQHMGIWGAVSAVVAFYFFPPSKTN